MFKFASVMDAAPFPVFAADQDMYYVYENLVAERFLGYDRAEIIGKRITDLVVFDPRLTMESFESAKRTGRLSGRVRYRHGDGSLRDADVNVFAQTLSDDTTVIVSLVHPMPSIPDDFPKVFRGNSEYGFSSDQMRLLHLIAEGFSDDSIAVLLRHTNEEVGREVQQVLTKMNVGSRTEAAVVAMKKRVLL